VFRAPLVHADLAAPAALAVADQYRSATRVEIMLRDSTRLVDAEPGAPVHRDQGSPAGAVGAVAGLAHDRDYLLDRGRIGWVAQPLVARRPPGR
jgi:hypothetical protein